MVAAQLQSSAMPTIPNTKPSFQELHSELDLSVNFVLPSGQEARYVRRTDDYFIVYLSSHNGCNKSCRFCHLTQSGQTSFDEASVADMLHQASLVLAHYRAEVAGGRQAASPRVHFNWMARGEPLASSVLTGNWPELTNGLHALALESGIAATRFNISSIFPAEATAAVLAQLTGKHPPVIFYSLYSMDASFRRRWLPKARPADESLADLAQWQRDTQGEVVLHWASIADENDGHYEVTQIAAAVERHGLHARFNLVRYNPFTAGQGAESSEPVLAAGFALIQRAMTVAGSRIVPRVGFDVKASCGMFVMAAN